MATKKPAKKKTGAKSASKKGNPIVATITHPRFSVATITHPRFAVATITHPRFGTLVKSNVPGKKIKSSKGPDGAVFLTLEDE